MKLLTKTALLYGCISLIGFAVAGYVIVTLLSAEMQHEVDENLEIEYELIREYLAESQQAAADFPLLHAHALPAEAVLADGFQLRDTFFLEQDGDEVERLPMRSLVWQQRVGDQNFQLRISQGLLETEDAIEAILWAMVPAILLLSLLMAVFLSIASRILWRPFQTTLQRISKFSPQQRHGLQFDPVSTQEFTQLNSILQEMTERVSRDYQLQKAFAENAAHELQTPLAIVQGKLEALLQAHELSPENLDALQASLQAIQRMKRLNQGLLMLAKIENRQFADVTPLSIRQAVSKQVESMQELAELREIQIQMKLQADPILQVNATLLDMLLSNLLRNALQHNHIGGRVLVELLPDRLRIHNTGPLQGLDPAKLFQRFQKQNGNQSGSGLGLAIVHEICEAMQWQVQYDFSAEMHIFEIQMSNSKSVQN